MSGMATPLCTAATVRLDKVDLNVALKNFSQDYINERKEHAKPVNLADISDELSSLLTPFMEETNIFSKRNVDAARAAFLQQFDKSVDVYHKKAVKSVFEAMKNDNLEEVQEIMTNEEIEVTSKHPNPNEVRTLLGFAVDERRPAIALYFLELGADCNEKSGVFGSPLHSACVQKNFDMVRHMVDNCEGDVNLKEDIHGCTPLHLATSNGARDIVAYLIAKGANVNEQDNFRRFTALHIACAQLNIEIVKLLLDNGADISKVGRDEEIPCHVLCSYKPTTAFHRSLQVDIAKILISKDSKKVLQLDRWKNTCLHRAVTTGNHELVRYLIEVNPSPVQFRGCEIPIWALFKADILPEDRKIIMNYLLDAKANINTPSREGQTLLHYAVERADLVKGAQLLYGGIDTNAVNCWKQTPLEFAIARGNHEFVKLLLRNASPRGGEFDARCETNEKETTSPVTSSPENNNGRKRSLDLTPADPELAHSKFRMGRGLKVYIPNPIK